MDCDRYPGQGRVEHGRAGQARQASSETDSSKSSCGPNHYQLISLFLQNQYALTLERHLFLARTGCSTTAELYNTSRNRKCSNLLNITVCSFAVLGMVATSHFIF